LYIFRNTPHFIKIHNSYAVTPADEKKHQLGTPIVHIWDWTAECARRNGNIKNLLIACHGGYIEKENSQDKQDGLGINLGSGSTPEMYLQFKNLPGRFQISICMYVVLRIRLSQAYY
jgi:hypothetical protein